MKKTERLVYEGLGFPIRLINVPLKQVFGEWVLDINLNQLQRVALHMLARKPSRLTAEEVYFIRSYLELSTHAFAKMCGVTHAAVLKWESRAAKNEYCHGNLYTLVCAQPFKSDCKRISKDLFGN